MFEIAELGQTLPKETYKKIVPDLRLRLITLQQSLRKARFPVIIVIAGVDGAGKGETLNLLHGWLDPRWLVTNAYGAPSDEERERPEFWRYWRDMPPKGKIGFVLSSWYSRPVLDYVYDQVSAADYGRALDRIAAFERTLADDGALILKFWMHLGKKEQKKRLKKLESDPLTSWRVRPKDWEHWRRYDKFIEAAEKALSRTSVGHAPWWIIEGTDHHHQVVSVANKIIAAIERHLTAREIYERVREEAAQESVEKDAEQATQPRLTLLDRLDMSPRLPREEYKPALRKAQARLNGLYRRARDRRRSLIIVFEGPDAAGKGGAIRRLVGAMDARDYRVIPIAKPTDEEAAQHYLWRFWRHVGRAGRVTIYDRSWYGRVLVERVEGFATEAEWRRAYREINEFEEHLTDQGIILVKFWIHITKEEQALRFKARAETPYKKWKLTEEDWRNREKWDMYALAVHDMVARTSTLRAPWFLIPGNDKLHARVAVINRVAQQIEEALDREKSGRRGKKKRKKAHE